MTPAPTEQLHLPVQPCLILQHTCQPDLIPTPGLHLTRPKWKGPAPAPHPAPTPRRLNQNLLQDQVVKTVMAVTQHPKRAMRPMKKMRPIPMAKPPGMGKAQMAEALTVKTLTRVVRLQIMTGEPGNPTARLKGQMLRAVPAPSETDGEIPTRAATPVKETKGGTLNKGGQRRQPQLLSDALTAQLGQQGY